MVLGVAGGYCAGKDAVARLLEEAGYPSVDVDAVGHRALEESRETLVRLFGPSVLDAEGRVDRRALGRIVFRRTRELRRLEAALHPRMREIVAAEVARLGRHCVINAAILYRMGLHELCDLVLCVRAPLLSRLRRASSRDGLAPPAALRRMWAQRGICLKPKGARVDTHTVRNAGSIGDLKARVLALLDAQRSQG